MQLEKYAMIADTLEQLDGKRHSIELFRIELQRLENPGVLQEGAKWHDIFEALEDIEMTIW